MNHEELKSFMAKFKWRLHARGITLTYWKAYKGHMDKETMCAMLTLAGIRLNNKSGKFYIITKTHDEQTYPTN
jgi:hypothetical protein